MNHRSDIDRVMEVWMADGPNAIPDRVVDVVAARIGVQRQRRAWPFSGRTTVTTQIKLIAALAAALVVAVVGYSLLPGTTGPGATTAPTSSPQPTAAVTAAPSASAECPQWLTTGCGGGAGILSAGSHATRAFRPAFTFSVPEESYFNPVWVNDHDEAGYYSLFLDNRINQDEFARSETIAQTIFMGFNPSPWFTCESVENNRGATAAEMFAAARANEALAVSVYGAGGSAAAQGNVGIGGLRGKGFDVRRNPDWTGTCPGDSDLPPWRDPENERSWVALLDVPGRGVLVIIVYSMYELIGPSTELWTDFCTADNPCNVWDAISLEAGRLIDSFRFEQ